MDDMSMPKQGPEMMEHLTHVDYPASKQDLVEACEKMSDIPEDDKKWFMEKLPEGSYNSANDVKAALGMQAM